MATSQDTYLAQKQCFKRRQITLPVTGLDSFDESMEINRKEDRDTDGIIETNRKEDRDTFIYNSKQVNDK